MTAGVRPLRLAFMGTPDFAVTALEALADAGHSIVAAYSQPPRPAGRGNQVQKSPVHRAAERRGIPVLTPRTLRTAEAQAEFRALDLDIAVVAAYGLILPQAVLDAPRLGCLNIHASLLPRWRGAAPIQRALLAGDGESGITIMQMDAGLDTGAMLLRRAVPIGPAETAATLHDRLAVLGAGMIVEALEGVAAGSLPAVPQPEHGVTYAAKLTKEDGRLDFTGPVEFLLRQVRSLTPWPGTWFDAAGEGQGPGERIKVLAAEPADGTGTPGELLDDRLTLACGSGAVRLTQVQRPGRGPVDGAAFLRGFPHRIGARIVA